MEVPIDQGEEASDAAAFGNADLVIDGLIGYSLAGPPHGRAADLIRTANDAGTPVLSLDVPSGLSSTNGTVLEPTVRASATLTLALPKHGLLGEPAREIVGELYLADIGVPPALYVRLGLENPGPVFAAGDIVRLL